MSSVWLLEISPTCYLGRSPHTLDISDEEKEHREVNCWSEVPGLEVKQGRRFLGAPAPVNVLPSAEVRDQAYQESASL